MKNRRQTNYLPLTAFNKRLKFFTPSLLIKFSLLLCVNRLFFKQFYAYGEMMWTYGSQYFIGKVQIVREGGEILVAEKPRHDWPTHGAGGDFIYYDAHKFTPPLDTINV